MDGENKVFHGLPEELAALPGASQIPHCGSLCHGEAELLVFNVSCVEAGEEVATAQLHLHRRRLAQHRPRPERRRRLAPPYRVRLYQVSRGGGGARALASLAVAGAARGGWRPLDVAPALRELLLMPPPALLGVRFEAPGGRDVPAAHFLRAGGTETPAFLVVFSEDAAADNEVRGAASPAGAVADLLLPPDYDDAGSPRLRHQPESEESEEDDNVEENLVGERRVARSIVDNELPEVPARSVPRTSPDSLLRGRHTPENAADDNTIPLPPQAGRWHGARRRQGKARRREHHRRRPGKPLDQEESLHENSAAVDVPAPGDTCRRRRLVVDFADIGWSGWIIEPRSFQAHYCAGRCPFPLSKALKPTNHATIQSLVHAIGSQPGVPAPCCVPDSLSAMSLLYVDDVGNVVLKSYPAMTVDTCACR